ncbi:MAG: hypothetical protein R2909_05655 [Gemmatimonadales bacterium]
MPPLASSSPAYQFPNRGVFDRGVFERDDLDHRGVELVSRPAWKRRATFQIADVRPFFGDDRNRSIAGVLGVDPEVGGEIHRADALRDEHERAVREDRRVERREGVVRHRHDRPEILLDQVRIVLLRLEKGRR